MREILFRAWDKKYNRILDIHNEKNNNLGKDEWWGITWDVFCGSLANLLEDEDIVLMQFTGLKDKNGKNIYEGDLVKIFADEAERIIEIKWSDEITNCGECSEVQATGFDLEVFCESKDREIIGNVWENSELLKNENGHLQSK